MNKPNTSPSDQTTAIVQSREGQITISYLFWLLGLMGVNGAHRIYNGKIASGLLWFCTFGLFGIGQIVDLFLIPDMAESKRMKLLRANGGVQPGNRTAARPVATQTVEPQTREQLMVKILQAARSRQGTLTVPQAVMDTQLSFDVVEDLLMEMHRKGYASMENDLDTGVIVYQFVGL